MESDCNCPCHFTEQSSERSEDCDRDERERRLFLEMEGICNELMCPVECIAFPGDCNCSCHRAARAAWCRFDQEPEASTAIEVTSAEEGNCAEESSDEESN